MFQFQEIKKRGNEEKKRGNIDNMEYKLKVFHIE